MGTVAPMDARTRATLRDALKDRYPWVADADLGPCAVVAGECDACGREARLVATCGPVSARYVGRNCLVAGNSEWFCDGHFAEARVAAAWAQTLPAEADTVARVWWVATGEVKLSPPVAAAAAGLALPLCAEVAT